MTHHILIGTDSRGRGLADFIKYINPFPSNWANHLIILPGRNISAITDDIINKIKILPVEEDSQILVAIAGGICNLTEKRNINNGRGYLLNYSTELSAFKVNSVQTSIQESFNKLTEYNAIIKFATIPPVSLAKNAMHFSHTLSNQQTQNLVSQQSQLETDIQLINNYISSVNEANGARTIRWDNDIIKHHMKRRGTKKTLKKITKFVYNNMDDGVHPNSYLRCKWFYALCQSIVNDINEKLPLPEILEYNLDDEQQNENDDDTWDFKRA